MTNAKSNHLPVWGFLFVHGFISSAEVLRLDAVSRFASNVKIAKRYYWLPAMYMVPIFYFTVINENALFRNLMLGVFSFVVITLTAAKFFKSTSKENKNLYKAAGILYSSYGVLLLAHSLSWLMVPQESVLTSGKIHQLYLEILCNFFQKIIFVFSCRLMLVAFGVRVLYHFLKSMSKDHIL